MKYLSLLFVALFFFSFGFSQEMINVTGQLQNEEGLPVSFATITFENTNDSSIFKEILSESEGNFAIELEKGIYSVLIQPTGSGITTLEKEFLNDTDLGVIVVENVISLGKIIAEGEKPLYRLELDKRVYDMERDPSVRGANLSDALNNVPSVQVDAEGTVSLRGNSNVRILINGKPSAMTGISDVGEALKNIPAETVQRVEVVTNPSARYDAEGGGGIINIVLKKGSNQGFNANFGANVGYQPLAGLNASLNYKTKKWNWFMSPYLYFSSPEGKTEFVNRFFSDTGVDTIQKQNGTRNRERLRSGVNLGFEHYLSEKSTLTISGNYRHTDGTNTNTLRYQDFSGTNLYQTSVREEIEDETDQAIEGNLGYKYEFDDKGNHYFELQTSASYGEEDEFADIVENVTLGEGESTLDKTNNKEQERRYLIQADYVKPLGEKGRFEAGYKSEFETQITDFAVLRRNATGQFEPNPNFTDVVDFTQNIHAVYTQYGRKFGKFSFLAGLRLENSDIRIISQNANEGAGSDDSKNYTNFFPSATLNYSLDKKEDHQLQLSYSRRIRRPWSRFMNPFFNFTDDRNTFRGNPDLNPTYSDSYELAFITKIGKTTLTPSVYYSHSTDIMNILRRLQEYQGQPIFVANPINAGSQNRYGAELVMSTQPARWWRLFGNINVFGYKSDGDYTDEFGDVYNFDGDGLSWFTRVSNNFSLPAKINFQLNGFYRGPENTAQSDRKGMFSLNASLSKDIMNGNGTLNFNVSDIFNTRRRIITNYGENYVSDIDMQWRPRQFTLSFTYRINQKKQRENRRQGSMDEGGGEVGY